MPKKLLIFYLLFYLGIHFNTFSQTSWGMKGGVNFAYFLESNPDISKKTYIGAELGGVAHWDMSQHFAIETGLDYSMKGVRARALGLPNYSINAVHYLQTPFHVLFLTGSRRSAVRLEMGSGVYWASLLSAKTDNLNFKNLYKNSDLGFDAFLGMRLGIQAADELVFRFVYSQGWTDISKSENTFVRNQVFKVQIIWFFPF